MTINPPRNKNVNEVRTMNFLDAAYEILKQAGKPLHYIEITNRALSAGLLDTKGQTPFIGGQPCIPH